MTLKEKLLAHMKEALRSKDSIRLNTIRSLISATKNQEIDLRRELQDEEVLSLITREVKKRKEASSLYKQGGRTDLMEKEDQEQLILQAYLPEQVSEEVLRKRITFTIPNYIKNLNKAHFRPGFSKLSYFETFNSRSHH